MNLFPNLPPDVQSFLFLLATVPGGFFSQFDSFSWFAALSPQLKLAFQVTASGLAAAALTILASPTLPAGTLANINGAYLVIAQVITAIVANFGTHIAVNVIAKPVGKALKAYAVTHGPQG